MNDGTPINEDGRAPLGREFALRMTRGVNKEGSGRAVSIERKGLFQCWGCSVSKLRLKRCRRCKLASYCSAECMERHRVEHKRSCTATKNMLKSHETLTASFDSFEGGLTLLKRRQACTATTQWTTKILSSDNPSILTLLCFTLRCHLTSTFARSSPSTKLGWFLVVTLILQSYCHTFPRLRLQPFY